MKIIVTEKNNAQPTWMVEQCMGEIVKRNVKINDRQSPECTCLIRRNGDISVCTSFVSSECHIF